jgi:hypothetical protein
LSGASNAGSNLASSGSSSCSSLRPTSVWRALALTVSERSSRSTIVVALRREPALVQQRHRRVARRSTRSSSTLATSCTRCGRCSERSSTFAQQRLDGDAPHALVAVARAHQHRIDVLVAAQQQHFGGGKPHLGVGVAEQLAQRGAHRLERALEARERAHRRQSHSGVAVERCATRAPDTAPRACAAAPTRSPAGCASSSVSSWHARSRTVLSCTSRRRRSRSIMYSESSTSTPLVPATETRLQKSATKLAQPRRRLGVELLARHNRVQMRHKRQRESRCGGCAETAPRARRTCLACAAVFCAALSSVANLVGQRSDARVGRRLVRHTDRRRRRRRHRQRPRRCFGVRTFDVAAVINDRTL